MTERDILLIKRDERLPTKPDAAIGKLTVRRMESTMNKKSGFSDC
jgi:hypothetical protein